VGSLRPHLRPTLAPTPTGSPAPSVRPAATAAAATLGRRGNPQNKNLGFNPPGSLL
jgi:hypothetical protein